jgi:predicted unusual protein kinase regulating ubiquinone biosynthesis (AarF/ABC1/UbiB family)
VLRSLRALILFWTIFASYALQWLLAWVLGRKRLAGRGERVHRRNAQRLTDGFTRLRGVFIKLGQVLSVLGGFLPRAYGLELERLQDQVPPHSFREVRRRLREAFGPNALERFASFEQEPLAAASLAQVHRAVSLDGRALAVKVLYPNVAELIRRDLAVLRLVEPVLRRLFGLIHIRRVLGQLSDMLARETDYAHERANIERIRAIFAGRHEIVIPEVVEELCAGAVLTMSLEEGTKIGDLEGLEGQGIDREAVARLLVDCYFTMLLVDRVFHADPHPGNFLVRRAEGQEGPTLVILDFGAVEDVTDDLAEGMKMVVMGGMMRNNELILLGVERMGFVADGGDREMLGVVGRGYLETLADVRIDDFSKLDTDTMVKLSGFEHTRGKLREIMKNVYYPDGFFYVERTLILLFGLVGRLSPKVGLPGLVVPFATRALLAPQAPAPPRDPPA